MSFSLPLIIPDHKVTTAAPHSRLANHLLRVYGRYGAGFSFIAVGGTPLRADLIVGGSFTTATQHTAFWRTKYYRAVSKRTLAHAAVAFVKPPTLKKVYRLRSITSEKSLNPRSEF